MMMYKWLASIGATILTALLAALKIVTMQRDSAREESKQKQAHAEASEAIRQAELRLTQAQREAQLKARQVSDELNQNRDQRPTDNFGDSRIRMRQHNKD